MKSEKGAADGAAAGRTGMRATGRRPNGREEEVRRKKEEGRRGNGGKRGAGGLEGKREMGKTV